MSADPTDEVLRYHKYTLVAELRDASRAVLLRVLHEFIVEPLVTMRVTGEVKAF